MPHILFRSDRRMLPEARRPRITREGDAWNAGKGAPERHFAPGGRQPAAQARPPALARYDPGAGCVLAVYPRKTTMQKEEEPPQRRGDSSEEPGSPGKTLLTWAGGPREVPTT